MLNQSHFLNIIPTDRRKISSNMNGKSSGKHSYSKSQQDPNSKNPAAGGQARSLSSPHSPAVGNVARGGQEPQTAPFVRAIVSCIHNSAKEHNVDVKHTQVVAFANKHASQMPDKMQKFEQSDVDHALSVFQAEYVPPQPHQARAQAQSPIGRQQSAHTPFNLFGQLLYKGKEVGIPKDRLIPYLKWWTSLPAICDIAEKPSPADVDYAFKEMLKAISQGGLLLRQIVETGELPQNVILQVRKVGIPFEFVFVFYECPRLLVLQRALCMKNADGVSATAGFFEGFLVHSDGHLSHFKQSVREDKSNPTHMEGGMAIVFPSSLGKLRLKKREIHVTDDPMKEHEKFDPTDQYHGENSRDSWPGWGRGDSAEYIIMKPGDIPSAAQQVDLSKRDEILRDSEFLSFYQRTMMDLRGVPIPVREHVEHQDAAEVASAESFSELTRCKHGNCVGGQFNIRCNDCDWGM